MAMLRAHLMQNWFGYSEPAMEEALYETTILRQFSGLSLERIPDEITLLNSAQERCVRNEGNSCCEERTAANMHGIGGRLDRF